ncbi:hypothetical protein AAG747_06925 [Rapidithrix thailandica]|uniref:Uncharacterized protein n=1 Tax=Rapidithrix thailandica TaxID=413964 RepID=A0AAW9RRS7_9BACT
MEGAASETEEKEKITRFEYEYDVTTQTTYIKSDSLNGMMVTRITSTSTRVVAPEVIIDRKDQFGPKEPIPQGDMTKTVSITEVYINGIGGFECLVYEEKVYEKPEGQKDYKEMKARGGVVNLEMGTIDYRDGSSKDLDPNLASDVAIIKKFNKEEDIDFPRASMQDELDKTNIALGLLGLIPTPHSIGSILIFFGAQVLPGSDELAQEGFEIQRSQYGNIMNAPYHDVMRKFKPFFVN